MIDNSTSQLQKFKSDKPICLKIMAFGQQIEHFVLRTVNLVTYSLRPNKECNPGYIWTMWHPGAYPELHSLLGHNSIVLENINMANILTELF